MKKLTIAAVLVSLIGAPFIATSAVAATRIANATMQVSFTITESCNVQSAAQQTSVACQHQSLFQLQRNDGAAVAATSATGGKIDAAVQQPAGQTPTITVYF